MTVRQNWGSRAVGSTRARGRTAVLLGHPAGLDKRARGLSLRVLLRLRQDRPAAVRASHAAHGDVLPVWQGASPRPYLAAITGPGQIRLRLPAECVPRYMWSRYELHVDLASGVAPVARLRGPDRRRMVMLRVCCRSCAARDHTECNQARDQRRAESSHVTSGSIPRVARKSRICDRAPLP